MPNGRIDQGAKEERTQAAAEGVPARMAINRPPLDRPVNLIAMDFGSESISAFLFSKNTSDMLPIDLQRCANVILNIESGGISEDDIEFLLDPNGTKSKRMRNRFTIRPRTQPRELTTDHAKLVFMATDEEFNPFALKESGDGGEYLYKTSLFEFFHKKNSSISPESLPNPKLTFQYGVRTLIPEIVAKDGQRTRYEPKELVHHLILQIINNFVLSSRELKMAGIKAEDADTWLLLTVPNVYSLTHVGDIVEFLRNNSEFGDRISYIYESDAMAYFMGSSAFESVGEGKENAENAKRARALINGFLKRRPEYDVLSIDVGHGTTDLSLLRLRPSDDEYSVRARTGRAEGGGKLNHILAGYFNECLHTVLGHPDYQLGTGEDKSIAERSSFDLLSGTQTTNQCRVLTSTEKLVFEIKKSMDERFRVGFNREEQQKILREIGLHWLDKSEADLTILEKQFLEDWTEEAVLESLPSYWGALIVRAVPQFIIGRSLKLSKKMRLVRLRDKIKEYIGSNSKDLIEDLLSMARSAEAAPGAKAIMPAMTMAVISGQASQFRPLRKEILNTLGGRSIPARQTIVIGGDQSKDGCALGAIANVFSNDRWTNSRTLHGTYGFCDDQAGESASSPYTLLDGRILNEGRLLDTGDLGGQGMRWFFFTPSAASSFSKNVACLGVFDSRIALIKSFGGVDQFQVKYDAGKIQFEINGQMGIALQTYGGNATPPYDKAWPAKIPCFKRMPAPIWPYPSRRPDESKTITS